MHVVAMRNVLLGHLLVCSDDPPPTFIPKFCAIEKYLTLGMRMDKMTVNLIMVKEFIG